MFTRVFKVYKSGCPAKKYLLKVNDRNNKKQ